MYIPLCNLTCSLVQPTTKTSSILQLSFIFAHSLAPFSFPFLSPVFSRLLVFEVVFLHPGVYHLKGPLYPLGAPHSFPCPFLGHYISYFLLLLGQQACLFVNSERYSTCLLCFAKKKISTLHRK